MISIPRDGMHFLNINPISNYKVHSYHYNKNWFQGALPGKNIVDRNWVQDIPDERIAYKQYTLFTSRTRIFVDKISNR